MINPVIYQSLRQALGTVKCERFSSQNVSLSWGYQSPYVPFNYLTFRDDHLGTQKSQVAEPSSLHTNVKTLHLQVPELVLHPLHLAP